MEQPNETKKPEVAKPQEDPPKCGGVPEPTYNPTPNGYWSCEAKGWVWIEEV